MSFVWRIYGENLVKERENKLWQFILRSREINRKKEWKEIINDFFGDSCVEYLTNKFYLHENSSVYSIELNDTSISIHFNKNFLPQIMYFIETMFPNETIGISFSGCDVTKRNNEIISIELDGEEIYQNGLDQLKNRLFAL